MDAPLVVLVSGSGTNMMALVDSCEAGEVRGRVVAVGADRDCAGLRAARARDIDVFLVDPKGFATRESWSEALLDEVLAYEPRLVVSAGFMRILSPVFVQALTGRLVNLHPSLLPSFPGAHAVRDALAAGARVTGTTVHFIDEEVDHGRVIAQEEVPVLPGDDEDALHARIKEAEHRLLPRAVEWVVSSV